MSLSSCLFPTYFFIVQCKLNGNVLNNVNDKYYIAEYEDFVNITNHYDKKKNIYNTYNNKDYQSEKCTGESSVPVVTSPVCGNGGKLKIQCLDDGCIMIDMAHYTCSTQTGTNDPGDLAIVRLKCEGQRSECEVTADRATFGNSSCPNSNITEMHLMVTYHCMGGRKEGNTHKDEGGDLCVELALGREKCSPPCTGSAQCLQNNGVFSCYCLKGMEYRDGECKNMTTTIETTTTTTTITTTTTTTTTTPKRCVGAQTGYMTQLYDGVPFLKIRCTGGCIKIYRVFTFCTMDQFHWDRKNMVVEDMCPTVREMERVMAICEGKPSCDVPVNAEFVGFDRNTCNTRGLRVPSHWRNAGVWKASPSSLSYTKSCQCTLARN